MTDPLIYKLFAVAQILIWGPFFIRYWRVLHRNGSWHTVPGERRRIRATFAWALLIMAGAMVGYSTATVLRQFLGLDYWGRDAVRLLSSGGFLFAGVIFHRVLNREKDTPRPLRRSTDLH